MWPMFVFGICHLTLDGIHRSNKGHITLKSLCLKCGVSYDQSVHETHMVGDIGWPLIMFQWRSPNFKMFDLISDHMSSHEVHVVWSVVVPSRLVMCARVFIPCLFVVSNMFYYVLPRGSSRRGKSGGLAWIQRGMWENVNEFPKVSAIYFWMRLCNYVQIEQTIHSSEWL